ncbi:MAG: glycosyltransferase, partial [Geminicoccaceae bacterium]
MGWRCLFWVQSLLGSGHLRRALLVAEAMAARGIAVTLVNGGPPGPWPAPAGVSLEQLPPIVARDFTFSGLVGVTGVDVSADLWRKRQRILVDLMARHRPQVVMTEMFPFGRRAFRGEILPLLEETRKLTPRPVVLASVRDVLVSKGDSSRYAWMVEACLEHYDRVLVHGDERLLTFAASFPQAGALGDRVVHTGFVHPGIGNSSPATETAPAVLVSAGGGVVGERLLRAAIVARPRTQFASSPWLLVGGQNLPAPALAGLQAELPHGCLLAGYRADLASLMGQCTVSVSQAGYNSVVEGLAAQARMVLVPFAAGAEDEQEQRARRLQELGLAERIGERELNGTDLA